MQAQRFAGLTQALNHQYWRKWLATLALLLCSTPIFAESFSISFIDHYTQQPIPDTKVVAKQQNADGSLTWAQRKHTNEQGVAEFDLDFSESQRYVFELKAFNNVTARVGDIRQAANTSLTVGKHLLIFKDGTESALPLLAKHRVRVEQYQGDGSTKTVANTNTDELGQLKLDLATGSYRIKTKSTLAQRWLYLSDFEINQSQASENNFNVGETPLRLSLIDAISNQPIANQEVTARRITADGNKWYGRQTTDETGQLVWEIEGLNDGREFLLSTRYFGKFDSKLSISQAGEQSWALGQFQVKLKDGSQSDQPALTNYKVTLKQTQGEQIKHVTRFDSNDEGNVLFDLSDFNPAQGYFLEATSPADDRTRYQLPITAKGAQEFVIGSTPLEIQLSHARTGAPMAETKIALQKWHLEEEKFKGVRSAKTNAQGQLVFDIKDFDGRTPYRLHIHGINNFRFYSQTFTQAGKMQLQVGKVQVQVRDGRQSTLTPLADYNINIKRYDAANDKYHHHGSAKTDANGLLQIDLPEPPAGQQYRLQAKSLTDHKHRVSTPIGINGDYEFVVGNPPVNVQVFDLVSNQALSNHNVVAQTLNEAEEWVHVRSRKTDELGIAAFDLDGIGTDKAFRFKVNKYQGAVYSDMITTPSDIKVEVGTLPVTLRERESGDAIINVRITAFAFADNGELDYQAKGKTDEQGRLIFDLPELGQQRYILKAHKPFDGVSKIYSPVVLQAGAFDFVVGKDDDTSLDTQAPSIEIAAPIGDQVADQGFTLAGFAEDDKQLEQINIQVWDNQGNLNELSVLASSNGNWSALIPADWLSADSQIGVAATAIDRIGNQQTVNRQFDVINDQDAPTITITSHQDQDKVSQTGFTLAGYTADNIQVSGLTATVSDVEIGTLLDEQAVAFDPQSGEWAFYLSAEQLNQASQLNIRLSAQDSSDNQGEAQVALQTILISPAVQQLARRATFGMTPTLQAEITELGAQAWLDQQLAPAQIDDSQTEALVEAITIENLNDLRERELTYQIYSRRQLQQVMAWFWENHFSTNFRSHNQVAFEASENKLFREYALTNFRQLLEVSAKSPAMLTYLNNIQSRAGRLNENYARELMELHTLGVDGGYSEQDIIALARIFTGWQVSEQGEFEFSAERHDSDNKVFLGEQIVGGGIEEGEGVLTLLAQHPSTASFVCKKLVQFWVSDEPQANLQASCANTFSATNGDIAAVLMVIFNAGEFSDSTHIASKIKTPLEFYVSAIRATQATPALDDGIDLLNDLGMRLFERGAPDGYGDEGADWINGDAMLQRTRFALRFALENDGGEADLWQHLQAQGVTQTESIIDYLFNILLTQHGDIERQQARAILNEGANFSMQSNDAENKLARLLASILAYPGFQYQ